MRAEGGALILLLVIVIGARGRTDARRALDSQEKVGAACGDGSLGVRHPGRGVRGVATPEHGEVVDAGGEGAAGLGVPVVGPGHLAGRPSQPTWKLSDTAMEAHLLLKPFVRETSL